MPGASGHHWKERLHRLEEIVHPVKDGFDVFERSNGSAAGNGHGSKIAVRAVLAGWREKGAFSHIVVCLAVRVPNLALYGEAPL